MNTHVNHEIKISIEIIFLQNESASALIDFILEVSVRTTIAFSDTEFPLQELKTMN